MKTASPSQLKKAKNGTKETPCMPGSWEMSIADAQERIAQLTRSIEMFKHNIKAGVPFPENRATQN